MVVEALAGWASGSLTLLADAGHMLTDVAALALSLVTAWLATRPADPSKTYGYMRWEILAALVNGAALFLIAGWVVVEAVSRFSQPHPIKTGIFLTVALVGLVANLMSLWLLHGHRHGSLNVRGAYLHILGDVLGSVGAVVAALVIRFTGWYPADPIISILLSLLILAGAWRLMRESTDILLEAAPAHLSLPEVRERILAVSGVAEVHDLHVWTVTSGMVAMSGHAVVPDLMEHPHALAGIKTALGGLGIGHVTIQLEVADDCEGEGESCRPHANLVARGKAGHFHGHAHSHDHANGPAQEGHRH